MVEVAIGWGGEFQGPEANVVKRFVVDAVRFVGIFDQLVDRESGVVWFNHGVGHFGRRDHAEGVHNSVWVLFA